MSPTRFRSRRQTPISLCQAMCRSLARPSDLDARSRAPTVFGARWRSPAIVPPPIHPFSLRLSLRENSSRSCEKLSTRLQHSTCHFSRIGGCPCARNVANAAPERSFAWGELLPPPQSCSNTMASGRGSMAGSESAPVSQAVLRTETLHGSAPEERKRAGPARRSVAGEKYW